MQLTQAMQEKQGSK